MFLLIGTWDSLHASDDRVTSTMMRLVQTRECPCCRSGHVSKWFWHLQPFACSAFRQVNFAFQRTEILPLSRFTSLPDFAGICRCLCLGLSDPCWRCFPWFPPHLSAPRVLASRPSRGFTHQQCAGDQDIQTSQTTANLIQSFFPLFGHLWSLAFPPPSFVEGHPDSPYIELNHVPLASLWSQGFR